MGPELELQARSDGMKALGVKENGGLSVDECLKCESNCEAYPLGFDKSVMQPMSNGNEDVKVKNTQFTTAGGDGLVEADCQYATESSSSSSFDDTASETEDATNTIDAEVGLNLFGDYSPTMDINGPGDLLRIRKRKLTTHWRTFVQPLMWRCKWIELQVKKLRALALKDDRGLANNRGNSPVEGFGLKSLPLPSDNQTDKLMKRKKRRRIEDTMNLPSYMSNHPLFSYFENKIRIADGSSWDENWGNQVNSTEKINGSDESEVHGERLWIESGVGDNSLEESLRQIGLLQTQVRKLKCRLDKVMTENTGQVSCIDNMGLVVPSNLTSFARSPASPPGNEGRIPVGSSNIPSHLTLLYNMGNVVVPKGAVPSHGEMSYISDLIEGTDQSLQGGAFMKAENEVLIYDERLKEGMKNYDLSIPMEKPEVTREEAECTFSKALTEPEMQTDRQEPLKMRSISKLTAPKKRRKRARQKSGSGGQSRRSSG